MKGTKHHEAQRQEQEAGASETLGVPKQRLSELELEHNQRQRDNQEVAVTNHQTTITNHQ